MTFNLRDSLRDAVKAEAMGSPCWRKAHYESWELAREHIASLLARASPSTDAATVEAYICRHCHKIHVGHNRYKERDMNDIQEALQKDGGVITVILGKGYDIPSDFAFHPQVRAVAANTLTPEKVAGEIPSNTRAVILTDRIEQRVYRELQRELRKRHLLFLMRKDTNAIDSQLKQIFPDKKPILPPVVNGAEFEKDKEKGKTEEADEAKRLIAKPGVIRDLIAEVDTDLARGVAETSRVAFRVAQERGVPTTLNSLAQAISVKRRKGGQTAVPRSVIPEDQRVMAVLDDAIAGLQLIRDYVERTESENVSLKATLDALRKALGVG